jgi:cytochrome P450
LTWVWYVLAQNPDVEQRLHEELDSILHGRQPDVADLPQLPYTRMVVYETLRLYPPICFLGRKTTQETIIGGYRLAKNTVVFVSSWVTHVDPGLWEQPQRCDPERFTPERIAQRPRYAYFPFGGGPTLCIGEPFALLEGQLILATIAQRYRLRLRPQQEIDLTLVPSLRPRYGLPLLITKRETQEAKPE